MKHCLQREVPYIFAPSAPSPCAQRARDPTHNPKRKVLHTYSAARAYAASPVPCAHRTQLRACDSTHTAAHQAPCQLPALTKIFWCEVHHEERTTPTCMAHAKRSTRTTSSSELAHTAHTAHGCKPRARTDAHCAPRGCASSQAKAAPSTHPVRRIRRSARSAGPRDHARLDRGHGGSRAGGMSVLQLHRYGYCDVCRKPFNGGETVTMPRNPDGTLGAIHPSCMGAEPVTPQPPTNGGTPVALAA